MLIEKLRNFLLLPSRLQWKKATLPTKQSSAAWVVGVIGLTLTIVIAAIGFWPQKPPTKAYVLSTERRAEFLDLLQISTEAHPDRVRIGCVAWSEPSCRAAGMFLKLLSEAGWQIEDGRVFKMEPSVPVDGVSITNRGDSIASLPPLPPHLGRWAPINTSQSLIVAAFRFMDSPVAFSRDPGLADGTLGIYFGPEPELAPFINKAEKLKRKPLLKFVKSGEAIKQTCLQKPSVTCIKNYWSWSANVKSYFADQGFDRQVRDEWIANERSVNVESIQRQQNLLLTMSLNTKNS
ncbi:MAG: hypothetical protein V4623_09345 [Pseudomonadota bacterium]